MPHHTLLLIAVLAALGIFVLQAHMIWRQRLLPKPLPLLATLSYVMVLLAGGYVFYHTQDTSAVTDTLNYGVIAPAILFFVAMSSTFKAQRTDATLIQRKAGIMIAAFAYAGLLSFLIL